MFKIQKQKHTRVHLCNIEEEKSTPLFKEKKHPPLLKGKKPLTPCLKKKKALTLV